MARKGPRPFRIDVDDPLERVKISWEGMNSSDTFPGDLHNTIIPHRATIHPANSPIQSTVLYLFTVAPPFLNIGGNLHGGASATIFDVCTSIAIAPLSRENWWRFAGVTRTLNCSYLKPVPKAMKVCIGCEVISLGKRGAVLRGWMREWDEERQEPKGELLVVCEHGKANVDHLHKGKL